MSVGGPLSNCIAGHLLSDDSLGLPYVFDTSNEHSAKRHDIVRRGSPAERFCTTLAKPGGDSQTFLDEDYALVLRVPSQLLAGSDSSHGGTDDRRRVAWCLAGCHTFGTFGAVEVFSNEEIIGRLAEIAGDDPFELVVKATWLSGETTWPDEVHIPKCMVRRDGEWEEVPFLDSQAKVKG